MFPDSVISNKEQGKKSDVMQHSLPGPKGEKGVAGMPGQNGRKGDTGSKVQFNSVSFKTVLK